MRSFLREKLKTTLRFLAVATIEKYKPGVIGIAGSVGKTSAREAIFAVLRSIRNVRATRGERNDELSFLLTILGNWEIRNGFFFWSRVILASIFRLLFPVRYPEILILEYAVRRPGDMKRLLEIARPQIAVLTAVGDIPSHVEFFESPEAVLREMERIVEVLPATGFVILNADDHDVLLARDKTRAHAVTYGFGERAEVRIVNLECRKRDRRPDGISFKIEHGGNFVPIRLQGVVGKTHAYAVAAASAIGMSFGVHLVRTAEALAYFKTPPHRLSIVSGANQTTIIDDTYDSSPLSIRLALEAVRDCGGTRSIAVFGDILEVGKYTVAVHEAIGKTAAKIFDVFITVGPRAKFAGLAARRSGMSKKNSFSVETADEVLPILEKAKKKGDLIFISGSGLVGLQKITEALQPETELKIKNE